MVLCCAALKIIAFFVNTSRAQTNLLSLSLFRVTATLTTNNKHRIIHHNQLLSFSNLELHKKDNKILQLPSAAVAHCSGSSLSQLLYSHQFPVSPSIAHRWFVLFTTLSFQVTRQHRTITYLNVQKPSMTSGDRDIKHSPPAAGCCLKLRYPDSSFTGVVHRLQEK